MSKGRYSKKKTSKKWILLLVLTALLAALIFLALKGVPGQNSDSVNEPAADAAVTQAPEEPQQMPENEVQQEAPQEQTDADEPSDEQTAPEETQTPTTAPTEIPEVIAPVEVIQRVEAEYEKWLAATMVVTISMEYPDFDLTGIYAASATALDDHMGSKGTYVLFTSEGNQLALHAAPLEAERTTAGTKDISAEGLGMASYDLVSPEAVDTTSMEELSFEELEPLIAQSLLISIYEH